MDALGLAFDAAVLAAVVGVGAVAYNAISSAGKNAPNSILSQASQAGQNAVRSGAVGKFLDSAGYPQTIPGSSQSTPTETWAQEDSQARSIIAKSGLNGLQQAIATAFYLSAVNDPVAPGDPIQSADAAVRFVAQNQNLYGPAV